MREAEGKRSRSWAGLAPSALALGLAAVVFWFPYGSRGSITAAGLAALAGGGLGAWLARGRLRTWAVITASLLASGAALLLHSWIGRFPVPARAGWPETAASIEDAALVAALSLVAAAALAFVSRRARFFRPVPAALVVLSAAVLLAAHRGGSIHLPTALSDFAWIRGWHPGLLLALCGAVAAMAAFIALYRPGRSRWPVMQGGLIALLLVLLLALAPSLALFHFATEDPLGLEGEPQDEDALLRKPAGREGKDEDRSRMKDGDPLGLRQGAAGGRPDELVPFQDEYSQDSANTPVAVVVLHDDVEPAGGVFYFRQVAFSRWNGRRLVRALGGGLDRDIFRRYPASRGIPSGDPPGQMLRQELAATISLLRDHVYPPALADPLRLEPAKIADPALFARAYRSVSRVRVGDPLELLGGRAGNPAWTAAQWRAYTEVPDDPRYRELAQQTLAPLHPTYASDPWARATAVGYWLQENTLYSLRSHHASAKDPTASYLFGDRVGYCVHLAHAAALLMRNLGLPARVAAGYAYVASNRGGGSSLLLRAGDAHAWAEVYLEQIGWVPIDPSPPSLDPPNSTPDMDLQRLLGELSRPKSQVFEGGPGERWNWPSAGSLLSLLAMALVGWALIGYLVKIWRRLIPALARDDPRGRLALRASVDRLGEIGLYREEGETWEAFARRVAPRVPSLSALTRRHLAASFGGHTAGKGLWRRLARSIAGQAVRGGGRRRWLGLLSPWRWTRTR